VGHVSNVPGTFAAEHVSKVPGAFVVEHVSNVPGDFVVEQLFQRVRHVGNVPHGLPSRAFWRFERFLAKSRPGRRGKFSPGFDAARKVFPCNMLRITFPPALAIHANEGYVQQLPGPVGARCFGDWF
jgi:hypothetical protein